MGWSAWSCSHYVQAASLYSCSECQLCRVGISISKSFIRVQLQMWPCHIMTVEYTTENKLEVLLTVRVSTKLKNVHAMYRKGSMYSNLWLYTTKSHNRYACGSDIYQFIHQKLMQPMYLNIIPLILPTVQNIVRIFRQVRCGPLTFHRVISRLVALLPRVCLYIRIEHISCYFLLQAHSFYLRFFLNVPVVSCFVGLYDYLNPFGVYTATITLQAASFQPINLRSFYRNMYLLLVIA